MLLSYGLPSIRAFQNVIVHMWFRNFLKTRILSLHYNYNLSNSPINITSYKEHLQAFIIDRIIKKLNYKEFLIKKIMVKKYHPKMFFNLQRMVEKKLQESK